VIPKLMCIVCGVDKWLAGHWLGATSWASWRRAFVSFCYHNMGHRDALSARCISWARPKSVKNQPSSSTMPWKGWNFLLDLTLDGCKRHFSKISSTSTPSVQQIMWSSMNCLHKFLIMNSTGYLERRFLASQWLLKCVWFLVFFGMGYFLL